MDVNNICKKLWVAFVREETPRLEGEFCLIFSYNIPFHCLVQHILFAKKQIIITNSP